MTKAIRIHGYGGPEALQWESVPMPRPGPTEVVIHHKAIGLNYIDAYHRSGFYPVREYPAIPGLEGAGVIEKVGAEVTAFQPGERIAYAMGPMGAYANYRALDQRHLVKLPDAISFETAAASMLKGLTVFMLLRRVFFAQKGLTILVHAAAGGVGQLLVQWAKHLQVTVIGTAGSEEKAALAKENGCDHVILYKTEDVAARVRELTGGIGANVIYDAVGKDTFEASLNSLCRMGLMVSYGQASGKVPPFDPSLLQQKGSLYFTRPTLMDYMSEPASYLIAAAELFDLIQKGHLRVNIGQTYWLQDAASAHRDLEARKTKGATVLLTH